MGRTIDPFTVVQNTTTQLLDHMTLDKMFSLTHRNEKVFRYCWDSYLADCTDKSFSPRMWKAARENESRDLPYRPHSGKRDTFLQRDHVLRERVTSRTHHNEGTSDVSTDRSQWRHNKQIHDEEASEITSSGWQWQIKWHYYRQITMTGLVTSKQAYHNDGTNDAITGGSQWGIKWHHSRHIAITDLVTALRTDRTEEASHVTTDPSQARLK